MILTHSGVKNGFRVGAMWIVALASITTPAAAQPPLPLETGLENALGLTFTPDGSTAFWVGWDGAWGSEGSRRSIFTSHLGDGGWSKPAVATFSGTYSDDDPFVSPDGAWLYFVSERPVGADNSATDANIWRYSLIEEGRLERLSVNSPAPEYSPVVTSSGALFFASAREGGAGQGDLYRAAPRGSGFDTPEPLGPAFNTATGEWNLWVSTDESEIVFEASSRPTNVSTPGDLYYSWRSAAGWTAAVPITSLNTGASDLMPRLHPDGRTLYYTTAPIGGQARIVSADWPLLRRQLRDSFAPMLLVANRSSHEVTFVDLALGEVATRISTGEGPHLLSNVSDGQLLVTGYGEFPEPHTQPVDSRPPFVQALNSRATLVDVVDGAVVWDTAVEDCGQPHASWIVGRRGFLTCESEQRVAILDIVNGERIGSFETRQQGSHVLSYDPASRTLVTSNTGSGSITLIDMNTGEGRIVELAPGSEGARAIDGLIWVTNATDGSVSVVDPSTATVVAHIESVCGFPIAFGEDTQDLVWVACFGSSSLVSIDRDSFAIRERIELPDQPLNLLLHPDKRLAYVSLPRQNAVAEIDLDAATEIRRISVGIEPDGLRWATGNR